MPPKEQVAPVVVTSEETGEGCSMTNREVEAKDTNMEVLVLSQGEAVAPKPKKERKPRSDGAGPTNSAKPAKEKATTGEEVVA